MQWLKCHKHQEWLLEMKATGCHTVVTQFVRGVESSNLGNYCLHWKLITIRFVSDIKADDSHWLLDSPQKTTYKRNPYKLPETIGSCQFIIASVIPKLLLIYCLITMLPYLSHPCGLWSPGKNYDPSCFVNSKTIYTWIIYSWESNTNLEYFLKN